MFNRICKVCDQQSFSSYGDGKWNCPYCGCDLTNKDAEPSEIKSKEGSNMNYEPITIVKAYQVCKGIERKKRLSKIDTLLLKEVVGTKGSKCQG